MDHASCLHAGYRVRVIGQCASTEEPLVRIQSAKLSCRLLSTLQSDTECS